VSRVLGYVLRFLLLLLVVRIVVRALARLFQPSAPRREASPTPRVKPAEDLVLDRVCHTHVPRSRALVARIDGHEEHFCSAACRDEALAAVSRAS
jgi:hypothetical protein